jgi:hypothetical protein
MTCCSEITVVLHFNSDPQDVRRPPGRSEAAFDIAEHVLGQDFYGPIIDTLKRYAGYVTGNARRSGADRAGIAITSSPMIGARTTSTTCALERLIDAIRHDYG